MRNRVDSLERGIPVRLGRQKKASLGYSGGGTVTSDAVMSRDEGGRLGPPYPPAPPPPSSRVLVRGVFDPKGALCGFLRPKKPIILRLGKEIDLRRLAKYASRLANGKGRTKLPEMDVLPFVLLVECVAAREIMTGLHDGT